MILTPVFQNRNYSAKILKPNVTYTVERMTRHAYGGCRRAEITVTGNRASVWEFAEYLGCPVEIFDDAGRSVWWGYVHEFKARTTGTRLYCRGWWERLWWRYYINHGTNDVSTTMQIAAPFLTATNIDNASGITTKETREDNQRGGDYIEELLNTGTTNTRRLLAEVNNQRRLRVYEEPVSSSSDIVIKGEIEFGASLDTMINKAWAVWSAPGENYQHNTATTTDADSAAEYGEKSEILTLSAASETQANALRDATVARRKYPIPTVDLLDGAVVTTAIGVRIPDYMVAAGQWVRLQDVIPQTADVSKLADISKVFVEEVEWSRTGGLSITPRDVPGKYQGGAI